MRPFLPTIQTLQLVTTSVRVSLVDSTVTNNLCHPSFDSNGKYESNNITASSSRPYHAAIFIFWSTRTVIRRWSPCLPHKGDRWPAAEWKQYAAGWGRLEKPETGIRNRNRNGNRNRNRNRKRQLNRNSNVKGNRYKNRDIIYFKLF